MAKHHEPTSRAWSPASWGETMSGAIRVLERREVSVRNRLHRAGRPAAPLGRLTNGRAGSRLGGKEGRLSGTTDEELLRALRGGDTDSLGVLVARWEQPLFRFVYRLLPRQDDARDICQETFLRVLAKADRFREGSRFSTWMYQIALNLCRDQARRRRRWRLLISERVDPAEQPRRPSPAVSTQQDPETVAERRERSAAVLQALERIPAEQREVLVLKEFEGLKFREIAEILDCPESTVKSRMYYGLSGLRAVLEREGIQGS